MSRGKFIWGFGIVGVLVSMALTLLVGFHVFKAFVELAPDVDNPKTHQVAGVAFSYPGNWSLRAEKSGDELLMLDTVTIESDASALLMIQHFAPSTPIDADEYLKNFVTGFDEELSTTFHGLLSRKGKHQSTIEGQFFGRRMEGQQLQLNLNMLGERVPVVIRFFSREFDDASVAVIALIPAEDLDVAEPGFELVFSSLRRIH